MKDEYTRLDTPSGTQLEPCPCCGSKPRVWQYIDDAGDATKVVMCTFGDSIGPQTEPESGGCPLYFPSMESYRATICEAVKYWNEFAKALTAIQRENRGAAHNVMRDDPCDGIASSISAAIDAAKGEPS